MAVLSESRVRWGVALIGGVVLLAILAYLAGGQPWLTSPAVWGSFAVAVASALLIGAMIQTGYVALIPGVPLLLGGAAAIVLGAWDIPSWLASPIVWLSAAGSLASGAYLVRTNRTAPARVVFGIILCLVAGLLGLLIGFAAILVYSVVLHQG